MSYSLTAIANSSKFATGAYDAISDLLKTLPIKLISFTNLSPEKAVEFLVDIDLTKSNLQNPNESDLQIIFQDIKQTLKNARATIPTVDLILQKVTDSKKKKKLIVFDMDSTLITQEVIEMIAAQANVEKQVADITTRAMNGELDFKQSLSARCALLRGIKSQTLWDDLKKQLIFTKGAKELCQFMKSKGCKLAVCSGGFLPLAQYVKEHLGLDYAFANLLQVETDSNGVEILSGNTIGEIVDGSKKRELLCQLAQENNIDLAYTAAIGDGANDLLMMEKAGFGIAWNAKPKVQQQAPGCLNSDSLRDILYVFGFDDLEIKQVLN